MNAFSQIGGIATFEGEKTLFIQQTALVCFIYNDYNLCYNTICTCTLQ